MRNHPSFLWGNEAAFALLSLHYVIPPIQHISLIFEIVHQPLFYHLLCFEHPLLDYWAGNQICVIIDDECT